MEYKKISDRSTLRTLWWYQKKKLTSHQRHVLTIQMPHGTFQHQLRADVE